MSTSVVLPNGANRNPLLPFTSIFKEKDWLSTSGPTPLKGAWKPLASSPGRLVPGASSALASPQVNELISPIALVSDSPTARKALSHSTSCR